MDNMLDGILGQIPEYEISGTADRVSVLVRDEENSGLLIGREGQTLAAIQYLVNRMPAPPKAAPAEVAAVAPPKSTKPATPPAEPAVPTLPDSKDNADAESFFEKGIEFGKQNKFQKAVENFDKAIKLNPNRADYFASRGHANYYLKQYAKAIDDYTKAIAKNPNFALAYSMAHGQAMTRTATKIRKEKEKSADPRKYQPSPATSATVMPAAFTGPFAKRLDGVCRITVKEAEDGERLQQGVAYVAPGGKHLRIDQKVSRIDVRVVEEPREALYKPSASVLFDAVAQGVGRRGLGVVLTGMGSDGLDGMRVLKAKGGRALAQSDSTCVVYGMPKAIVDAGLADEIVDIDEMGEAILQNLYK